MNKWLAILLFFPLLVLCQERKDLNGRVVETGSHAGISDVFVINKATGSETKTDSKGNFLLAAKPGDMITVYSTKTTVREFAISQASFKENPYLVSVNVSVYQLKEVVINDTVNSKTLNLPQPKMATVAQRRLNAASSFTIGTIIAIEPILNAISGRTKQLKRDFEVEKRVMLMDKIDNIYTPEEITEEFKIPAENVKGFIYYIVEDKDFASAMKAKNTTLAKFIMGGLAEKYLKLQEDDKK